MYKEMFCLLAVVTVLAFGGVTHAAGWDVAISGANPLHWYRFNEGGDDCLDSGRAGLDGTYSGVSLGEDGVIDAAAGFVRSDNDVVNFAGATDMSGPWTVEYVVKTTKAAATQEAQALHDGGATSVRLAGWTSLAEAGFTQYGVADYQFTPAAGLTLEDLVVQPDVWMHLVWRNDGSGMQLFFNGELMGTSTNTIDLPRLRIGTHGGSDGFEGVLDEAVVFDRALSDLEIQDHYAAMAGAPPRAKAASPSPADGAMLEAMWASISWSPGGFAVSHDLYIGDNLDDVNNGAEGAFAGNYATTDLIIGFAGYPVPGGLVPGTTYYWRIDEVNPDDPNSPWKGDVWSFWIPPRTAYSPAPADGARFVTEDVTLVWTGGFDAKLHTVYFGDNFDDVSNATGGLPQSAATFTPPGPLAKDTVYYWRVDEFDALATHKGDVWSFRTLPDIPIADPVLVGWWKLDEGQGSTALDWSGQNSHGTLSGNPEWVIGQDGGALKLDGNSWVDCGTPDILQVGQEITIACWINPTALGGERSFVGLNGAYSFKASGDHLRFTTPGILDHDADVAVISTGTWQHVADTFQPDQTVVFYINGVEAHRMTGSAANVGSGPFRIGTNQWNERFTGMIDDLRVYDKVATAEEITLAMRGDPLVAWDASPANGSNPDIDSALPLGWQPGDNASQHDVYFGTDVDAVTDADASDATGVYRGRQNATSFNPAEGVEWGGGPYYWRVDEVSNDGTIIKGRIWSFTVADFLLVDDFESYNDIEEGLPGSNLVYMTWADGFGIPTNGSTMGYAVAFQPTMETAIVHGGRQSAPMAYYNIGAAFSEVTRTLPAQDWTAHGVQELSLWFYGAATNTPGQLYVKVNGVKANCTGDSGDLSVPQWRECVVDLAAVGTNLQSVTSLSIGVDGIGATGMLLLDDIRLYQARGQ
ncbi:MAG: LamG domain-containing protein [Phycisphaerales bacterium]|nr:MAG: LamG domain-containing protein [Phycisphaerales bacterium]